MNKGCEIISDKGDYKIFELPYLYQWGRAVRQNWLRLKNELKSNRKLKKHYDRILIQIKNMANP